MYDLMTTLLSGSAIWAYLGQDYMISILQLIPDVL